jgi:flagellin
MGLVVNTNTAAINTSRILRRSTLDLNKSLERLSSGLRINRAADDAAGLAIAEGLRSQVKGFQVVQRNAQDGISLVQTAEGALSEVTGIIQRIRELAVQSANGTLQDSPNRTDLNAESTQLIAAVNEILTRTTFNGIDPFGATAVTVQTGTNNGQTTSIAGTGTAISTTTLGINALSIATQATASAALATLDTALTTVNTRRANLGAAQNRLEFTINQLGIREENAAAAESRIRDADIAKETIGFTRNQILVSAGTSILAQANVVPQTALQLLS